MTNEGGLGSALFCWEWPFAVILLWHKQEEGWHTGYAAALLHPPDGAGSSLGELFLLPRQLSAACWPPHIPLFKQLGAAPFGYRSLHPCPAVAACVFSYTRIFILISFVLSLIFLLQVSDKLIARRGSAAAFLKSLKVSKAIRLPPSPDRRRGEGQKKRKEDRKSQQSLHLPTAEDQVVNGESRFGFCFMEVCFGGS